MKMLISFLILLIYVCTNYAMDENPGTVHKNPLIHGLPSYYEPQLNKAIEKRDEKEVKRLCRLDPKLIIVLNKKIIPDKKYRADNHWISCMLYNLENEEKQVTRTVIPAKTNVHARL